MIQAVLFNLDGVLVRTDVCHYEAWKQLAYEQGIPFNDDVFRIIAGRKRVDGMRVLLKKAERAYSPMELWALSARKNDLFNDRILKLGPESILPSALETVKRLREMGMLNLYACIGDPVEEDEYLTRDSETFHARMGFIKVGTFRRCGWKFGRWYNMIWMEKLIGEHPE